MRLELPGLCVEGVYMQPSERDLGVLREWWGRVGLDVPMDAKGLWFGITELVAGGAIRTLRRRLSYV